MTTELSDRECRACRGDEPPLKDDELKKLCMQLPDGWKVVDEHHLHKAFTFDDFKQALEFTNRVGEIAEQQGHHPDIRLTYGEVEVEVWTHKVDGLTESDFILAAKADKAL